MLKNLKILQKKALSSYRCYSSESITYEEYIRQIRLLDNEIDRLELKLFKLHLQDTFPFEITSSSPLH